MEDDTLVVVTTDHGTEFPGGKKTLTDRGTEVMLMIRGPQNQSAAAAFSGGRVIEPMVTQLDLYPTICELLGLSVPHLLAGTSLIPLVCEKVRFLHEAIFAEQTYHGPLEPLRSVRTECYKYIRRHYRTGPRLRHDGPPSELMESFGWYDRALGNDELFDLYLDPMEACNRASDPAYATVFTELSNRLEEQMRRTGDCLLIGTFPSALRLLNAADLGLGQFPSSAH